MQSFMPFLGDYSDPSIYEELDPNCRIGSIAEIQLALEAIKRGYSVYMPIGHAHKADLILWKSPQRAITVQVKKGTYQKRRTPNTSDRWKFMVGSGRPKNNRGNFYTKYKTGDFDVLCGFIQERNAFVFYLLDEVAGVSSISWSVGTSPEGNWQLLDQLP